MNFLLTLNKRLVLIISLICFGIFVLFFISKYYLSLESNLSENNLGVVDADITEPKFAINNDKQKIFVTAKEGNFIDNDNILLKKNVKFESKNFSINSDNVIFNRKKQTAESKELSLFTSEKTKIFSEGFDIYDSGKKIKFYGNVKLIIK